MSAGTGGGLNYFAEMECLVKQMLVFNSGMLAARK